MEAKSDAGIAPFLKWAGGKRWLSERLTPAFEALKGAYIEPFLGSGAVFFRHLPINAVLSDANPDLIECYLAVRDDPTGVSTELAALSKRPPDDSYYDVRASKPNSSAGRAARFLFLNRTCWNGLYRVNLKGEFNVPRGTKSQILLPSDNFVRVSEALQSATLNVADFEESIAAAVEGDLIFADPPYTVAHNLNGFIKYNQKIFSWEDQQRLARALTSASTRGVAVIATNADHPDVRTLYEGFEHLSSLDRASVIAAASQNRKRTTELFVSNAHAGLSL
ncbi:MAG: Dam family site-specific DNA-(adenine-N6)-methyltransferase [Brevundimonas sp.]|uniref:DNA adenine methylase n=1 Tax=Brevundimonas sp. TaxID=1871086 RepID=UPI00256003E5|nr:Dam family site-specific DNA-(adenine-N6)-methyltransferase [Brevundimonas sp.]MDK2746683.1 Dam family site-specific DNA-(adenine-N6)-methyltransferase [Brevundimonas sp.]